MLVDHRQNARGRTEYTDAIVLPRAFCRWSTSTAPSGRFFFSHSVVARPGLRASTPLRWEELTEATRPRDFGMAEALERIERLGDLYEPTLQGGQSLGPALRSLRKAGEKA